MGKTGTTVNKITIFLKKVLFSFRDTVSSLIFLRTLPLCPWGGEGTLTLQNISFSQMIDHS